MTLQLFDTTLRDGEQSEGISFAVSDKIKIAHLLDELGVHYIEGGFPGSNPKVVEFFDAMRHETLKHAKLVAFGSTRHHQNKPEDDPSLKGLIASGVRVACIFGKTWDFHVTDALRISLEDNLVLIEDSIRYLKTKMDEVFFDAEHFFDGYKRNPAYALQALEAAVRAGVDVIVLCDTNGGTLPFDVETIVREIVRLFPVPIGIHAHNDGDCATANTLSAIHAGAVHVQGTLNGYGERCGNANLCAILPALKLKMGFEDCLTDEQLSHITDVSRHVSEIANLPHNTHMAYVGMSAFAHKGGVHVNAIAKHPETYEHIRPEKVGNIQRVLVSEQSGVSNLAYKAKELGVDIHSKDPAMKVLLKEIKDLEQYGYQFEEGEASFELMLRRAAQAYAPFFELIGFRVINDRLRNDNTVLEATVKLTINGKVLHTAGEGNGPVAALDHAFRKALKHDFPEIDSMHLTDYKVRVLSSKDGTDARVRVIIQSADDKSTWGTVGVSTNIIEASWKALVDSVEYKLLKERL